MKLKLIIIIHVWLFAFKIFADETQTTNEKPVEIRHGKSISLLTNSSIGSYGISWMTFHNGSFGFYIDTQSYGNSNNSSSVTYEKATEVFHDTYLGKAESFSSITMGTTYGFNNYFGALASIGQTNYRTVYRFFDQFRILGDNGYYWTTPYLESKISTQFGLFWIPKGFGQSSLSISVIKEINPDGTILSVGYAF